MWGGFNCTFNYIFYSSTTPVLQTHLLNKLWHLGVDFLRVGGIANRDQTRTTALLTTPIVRNFWVRCNVAMIVVSVSILCVSQDELPRCLDTKC